MLSGVGTIGIYNYSTKKGILSTKNVTDEEFIKFCNDELQVDETEVMNGYNQRTKVGHKKILEIWQQFADVGKPKVLSEDPMETVKHSIHISKVREVSTGAGNREGWSSDFN
mgnify:CR=1 FL=1